MPRGTWRRAGDAKKDMASGSGDKSMVHCPFLSCISLAALSHRRSTAVLSSPSSLRHYSPPSNQPLLRLPDGTPYRRASLAHRRCTAVHRCPRHSERPPPPSAAPRCVCPCRRPAVLVLQCPPWRRQPMSCPPHALPHADRPSAPQALPPTARPHAVVRPCALCAQEREGGKREEGMTGRSHHFIQRKMLTRLPHVRT